MAGLLAAFTAPSGDEDKPPSGSDGNLPLPSDVSATNDAALWPLEPGAYIMKSIIGKGAFATVRIVTTYYICEKIIYIKFYG